MLEKYYYCEKKTHNTSNIVKCLTCNEKNHFVSLCKGNNYLVAIEVLHFQTPSV